MPILLVLMVLGGLLGAGFFLAKQWQRARIRRTGTLVMAKVIQVQTWRDSMRADFSPLLLPGGKWWYEIRAEWTDPDTQHTYMLTSGVKKGLPRYQRDDTIPAYVSPYGNYMQLA